MKTTFKQYRFIGGISSVSTFWTLLFFTGCTPTHKRVESESAAVKEIVRDSSKMPKPIQLNYSQEEVNNGKVVCSSVYQCL